MPTLNQLKANRLNAQRCTGPTSVVGKARSSWNALKSGIHAESEVLPWEDPAERAILRAEYHDHHQPCTPEERATVDNLVHGEFLSRRFRRSEVKIILSKLPDEADLNDEAIIGKAYSDAGVELGRLQRRMDANSRAFHRDLDELRLLKAERPPIDSPPPLVLAPPPPEPAQPEAAGRSATPPDPPKPTAEPPADSRLGDPAPVLSTTQPKETKEQTEQSVSFRQTPETVPPYPGFNPKNPNHPPIELCPYCYQVGRILDGCDHQPHPDRLARSPF